jgi:hypothetical protein
VTRTAESETTRLARRVLFAFLVTFICARALVFLIMSRRVPLLYLHVRGIHVHHLNYGIALLTLVSGYLLFTKPSVVAWRRAALVYGLALGLTFDEFGMWLHLGGSYWQRASVDSVVVIAGLLGIVAYARDIERIEARHRWAVAVLVLAVVGFGVVLALAGEQLGKVAGPSLRELEIFSNP